MDKKKWECKGELVFEITTLEEAHTRAGNHCIYKRKIRKQLEALEAAKNSSINEGLEPTIQ